MLNFLVNVLIASAVWVALGTFLGVLFPDGSKGREILHGLAAFSAFCFLVAFAGSLACLAFTAFSGV